MNIMNIVLLILIGYLVGSIPTGWVLVKIFTGHEIRYHGSRSPGFTNVARVINLRLGLFVLIIDIAKAFILVQWLAPLIGGGPEVIYQVITGLTCIIGNVFTFWFRNFKGGKAVATSCGVFIALMPGLALIALGIWVIVFLISRYISLASILAVIVLSRVYLVKAIIDGVNFLTFDNLLKSFIIIALVSIVVFSHRENIARLIQGKEKKITFKKSTR